MPHATTPDGVKLYYEEAGSGYADPVRPRIQRRLAELGAADALLSRRAIAASPIPSAAIPALTCPRRARCTASSTRVDDARHMLDHLEDRQGAHRRPVAGRLRRSAFRPAQYADRALTAYACRRRLRRRAAKGHEQFRTATPQATAAAHPQGGHGQICQRASPPIRRARASSRRIPRGFAEFVKYLSEHPDVGSANTMENYQGKRPVALRLRGGVEEARPADADHLRRRGRALPAAQPLPQARAAQCRPRHVRQDRPHREHRGARRLQPRALELPGAGRGRQVDAGDGRAERRTAHLTPSGPDLPLTPPCTRTGRRTATAAGTVRSPGVALLLLHAAVHVGSGLRIWADYPGRCRAGAAGMQGDESRPQATRK